MSDYRKREGCTNWHAHDVRCFAVFSARLRRRNERLPLLLARLVLRTGARPQDVRFALLAATYAKQIGKVVAFSLACFRQSFNAGRDLAHRDTVYLAGAAAEIHPAALEKGAALKGTAERLRVATAQAAEAGVLDVPAVVLPGGRVFHGDAELEAAAEALAGR